MWRVASRSRCLRTRVSRVSFVVLILTLGYSGTASALPLSTSWQNGDLITYTQGDWGDSPTTNTAASILSNNYDTVYASTFGVLEVGISGPAGFSMLFTGQPEIDTYLPAVGPSGPLDGDRLNPSSSVSGAFGGEVLGLKLNIDFSDAGLIPGASGIAFGDLTLANFDTTLPQLNGLTLRQYLDVVNTALGGGSTIYSIADLDPVATQLNGSFFEGVPSVFAQDHLVSGATTPPVSVPEPSSLLLLGSGLTGLAVMRKKFKQRS